MPAGKRPYRKPAMKGKRIGGGARPRSRALRTQRVEGLESSLEHYFGLVERLGALKKKGTAPPGRMAEREKMIKHLKAGLVGSVMEIAENYTLSKSQKEVVRQIIKSLNKPTSENAVTALRLTCGLKFEGGIEKC